MKKKIQKIIIGLMAGILLISSVKVYASPDPREKLYYKKYNALIKSSEKEFKKISKTGDKTSDFLCQMLQHSKLGIDLAKNLLQYTKDEKLIAFAENMIKTQAKQAETISTLIEKRRSAKDTTDNTAVVEIPNENIFPNMHITALTGDINKDFLKELIAYHEAALQMAMDFAKATHEAEVKRVLEEIIALQNAQLQQVNQMLDSMN